MPSALVVCTINDLLLFLCYDETITHDSRKFVCVHGKLPNMLLIFTLLLMWLTKMCKNKRMTFVSAFNAAIDFAC